MLLRSLRHDRGRVGSDTGHFSNAQAGKFLVRVLQESRKRPRAIILCHLSRDHNTPEVARATVREILSAHRFDGIPVHAALRDTPLRKFSV
jgi:phosphoribosyl 1,2-cyclic phosphodiesterase